MGFFDFLKGFSRKKEEVKEIRLDELDSFVNSWSKRVFENTNQNIENIRIKIDLEKEELKKNIQGLETAKLKDEKALEKEKQFMEGNRKAYLQKVNGLLKEINLPANLDDILVFCGSFDKSLDNFGKTTIRNHRILEHFFGEEVVSISKNISHLVDLFKKVKEIVEDSKIDGIKPLKDRIKEFNEKIKRREEIDKEINLKKAGLLEKNKKIEEKEKELKEIKNTDEYKSFLNLVDKQKILEKELEDLKKQLFDSFSIINVALNKYERLTLDYELVRKYLDNSLNALLNDKELKIIGIFNKMKDSITKGGVELKDKKKDKILSELDRLNQDYLKEFLRNYKGLKDRLLGLKSEIEGAGIVDRVELLKLRLKEDEDNIEKEEQQIKTMLKNLEAVDVGELKKDMEKEIKDNINEEIRILIG